MGLAVGIESGFCCHLENPILGPKNENAGPSTNKNIIVQKVTGSAATFYTNAVVVELREQASQLQGQV